MALRCTRSDGSPAVLKLSPDLPVVSEQVAMLTAFGTSGRVPAVLAADVQAGAVLLELIEPGTRADELAPQPSAREWAQPDVAFACCPFLAGSSVLERAPRSERAAGSVRSSMAAGPRWSASYSWR